MSTDVDIAVSCARHAAGRQEHVITEWTQGVPVSIPCAEPLDILGDWRATEHADAVSVATWGHSYNVATGETTGQVSLGIVVTRDGHEVAVTRDSRGERLTTPEHGPILDGLRWAIAPHPGSPRQ